MKRLLLQVCGLCCLVLLLSGFTLDEIRELKRMGFSNEQIVEMQKAGTGMPTAVASAPIAASVPAVDDRSEYLQKLKEQGKGLLVVCATKEWPFRGPGYLNVDIKFPNGKWGGIGRAGLMEYFMNGQVTPPVFEKLETDDSCDGNIVVTHMAPIIISRYYGELEMGAATYEVKLTRNFKITEKDSGVGKTKRHKKFHGVQITPGMVTVLSYFWNENQKFGLDHVMTNDHRLFVERMANRFGPALTEIKTQHNE